MCWGERSRAGGGADARKITYDSHDALFFFLKRERKKWKEAAILRSDGCREVTGRVTWASEPAREVKAKASRLERSSTCIRLSTFDVRVAVCVHLSL